MAQMARQAAPEAEVGDSPPEAEAETEAEPKSEHEHEHVGDCPPAYATVLRYVVVVVEVV